MRRRGAVWGWVGATAAIAAHAGVAHAQLPVCPQPSPEAAYYTACAPLGRILVARLLYDLAIDHLLKSDLDPVRRRLGDLLRAFVNGEVLEKNDALRRYLDRLEPLRLVKLDTTTGTLQLDVAEEERRFTGTFAFAEGTSPDISWELPARLAGGYWRTPAVLQVAFWEGQRATFRVAAPNGDALAAEVECLVVSTDGVRIVTGGTSTPDVLVRFEGCL